MNIKFLIQQSFFVFRHRYFKRFIGYLRKCWLKMQGAKIGKRTNIPKVYYTWPHQISIGNNCRLEHHIYFHFDGIWSEGPSINIGDNVFVGSGCEFNITNNIKISSNSLIASGCKFIDHDHGFTRGQKIGPNGEKAPIILEQNVWLGCNVVVLKGVTIGTGAVVAAGATVTKSIPPNEIWGGVPAKKIGIREYN